MSMFLFFGGGASGGAAPVTLAAGDLTTAWCKHLATLAAPKNETERSTLTTAYSISSATDLSTVVARFLRTRTAP